MMTSLPVSISHGARILYQNEYIGTVRYVGPVDGTSGEWVGVEWDDGSVRGKHDGVRDGRRYFRCLVPNSGSFIRYNPSTTSLGRTFAEALKRKYIDGSLSIRPHQDQGSATQQQPAEKNTSVEHIVLGSSKGRIEVEAPGLDQVRRRVANIERIREMSLDGEGVASADDKDDESTSIWNLCRNVRGLNLAKNLISDWDTIGTVIRNLPALRDLNLDDDRFTPLESPVNFTASNLKELRLNGTIVQWLELTHLSKGFPNLVELQFGYNRLGIGISGGGGSESGEAIIEDTLGSVTPPSFPNLFALFLDGNGLQSWPGIVHGISSMPKLENLHLASNSLEVIPPPSERRLEGIRRINLALNKINIWSSLDALAAWCPNLQNLNFSDNPVVSEQRYGRQLIIARVKSLEILEGSKITPGERQDSELFYLSHIAASVPEEQQRLLEHPRWPDLCEKHGRPSEHNSVSNAKLSSKLIDITLLAIGEPISSTYLPLKPPHAIAVDIRVLPSMTVRALRLKIAKTLKAKIKLAASDFRLWALLRRGSGDEWLVRELADDRSELDYSGIEGGSCVAVLSDQQ